MAKIVALILILLASIGGGVYYMNTQNKPAPVKPVSTQSAEVAKNVSPTPNVSDDAIDSDITALDRDLSGLNESDKALTQEIEGL